MNLIYDPWLPVRRIGGERDWVRPADITSELTENPIIALDFPRPDWNAAVTELLIGLLACVMAPEDDGEWAEIWNRPPTPEQLTERLAPFTFAFNLGGDGPRCFQDFDALNDGGDTPISALLMDAPSEDSSKNNDLFIKQGLTAALSLPYAAAALITMQTFAPEGGAGVLTSMRGGGPLTTLATIKRRRADGKDVVTTLWDTVWANVPSQDWIGTMPAPADQTIFPWLAPTRSSAQGATLPADSVAHKLQAFFGLPRRIRLDFSPANGERCSLHGPEGDTLVRGFKRRPRGVKYEGWKHPLSPYRVQATGDVTAMHPSSASPTYRDWLAWVVVPEDRKSECAACIAWWERRLERARRYAAFSAESDAESWQSSVIGWGFAMNKMKALSWLEARIPYFDAPPDIPEEQWRARFSATVEKLVAGAREAGSALRYRLRLARFGSCDREKGSYSLPKTSPGKNAFEEIYESFWRETERDFLAGLKQLRAAPGDEKRAVRETFRDVLRAKALQLFDEAAGTDELADQDARRIIEARASLGYAFGETGDVTKALDLVTSEAQQKAAKRKAAKAKKKETAE